nr:DUF6629 family protein [Aeromicrobium sp. Leaf350]
MAGTLITAVGVDALRHVKRRDQLALATLPLAFGAHQLVETLVWWQLEGHVSDSIGDVATWTYLLIAIIIVPILVPYAFLRLGTGRSRLLDRAFVGAGVIAAALGGIGMADGVSAEIDHHHIAYSIGAPMGELAFLAYVVAACAPGFASRATGLQWFAALNLVVVALLVWIDQTAVVSLWCLWAAITSVLLNLWIRGVITGPADALFEASGTRQERRS